MSVDNFFFYKQIKGFLPWVDVYYQGDKIEIIYLNVEEGSDYFQGVILPPKYKFSFKSPTEMKLGEEVKVVIYYDGNSYEPNTFYTAEDKSIEMKGYITKKKRPTFSAKNPSKLLEYTVEKKSLTQLDFIVKAGKNEKFNDVIIKSQEILESNLSIEIKFQKDTEEKFNKILRDLGEYNNFLYNRLYLNSENKKERIKDLNIIEVRDGIIKEVSSNYIFEVNDYLIDDTLVIEENDKELNRAIYMTDDDKNPKFGEFGENSIARKSDGTYKNLVRGTVINNKNLIDKNLGQIKEVKNMFVKEAERESFLRFKESLVQKNYTIRLIPFIFDIQITSKINILIGKQKLKTLLIHKSYTIDRNKNKPELKLKLIHFGPAVKKKIEGQPYDNGSIYPEEGENNDD